MTDDLVKRLHWHRDFIGTNPWPDGYPFLREVRDRLGDAADRIEALTAENERMRKELEDIANDYEPGYPLSHDVIKYVARAALKEIKP